MEITPAGFIPYTEKTWNEFKEILATILDREALDCDFLSSDPKLKNFIVNFAEQELLSETKDAERIKSKTNIRLSNMVIQTSRGTKQYPVVNEYKGHHLMRTKYFKRNGESIEFGVVEVVQDKPAIILPNQ